MKTIVRILPLGAACLAGTLQAAALNEWTFGNDADGRSLNEAINSGTSSPLAQFSAGAGTTVFTTNRALLCVGEDTGSGGVWTNGAVLDAALISTTSGVHYLRYDLDYDLRSVSNNSGTVIGVYFTGDSGEKASGLVIGYDVGNLQSSIPANRPLTPIPGAMNIAKVGTFSAIAEVDLDSDTLNVWYDLSGSNVFIQGSPAFTKSITMTALDNLHFHATGDFRPAGSSDYAAVDNIRHTASWNEIVAPVADFSAGPDVQIVSVTVTNPAGTAGTDIGETNTVTVVVRNLSAPASNVISSVSAATHPEYFTITSSNTPVVLTHLQFTTNTFSLIANTNAQNGTYAFNVAVTGSGGVNTNTTFNLTVGSLISYLSNSISLVSTNGLLANQYEPGEVVDITVFSANTEVLDVSNVVNSLSANPAYFTISNLTSVTYAVLPVGAVTSTVYRVTLKPDVPNGTRLLFSVTNQIPSRVWPGSFELLPAVFSQGIPSVSPASISLSVLPGEAATNIQVTVTNSGNAALTFNITDNAAMTTLYTAMTGTRGGLDFVTANSSAIVLNDPNTNSPFLSSVNDGVSSAVSIGFNFPFYGATYSNLYVTADGVIGLMNTTNVPLQSADGISFPVTNTLPLYAPFRGAPLIAPFWGSLAAPAGSIRMISSENSCLVISYYGVSKDSGLTNLQFQAALYTNGCIDFRYKTITGVTNAYGLTNVMIGIQGRAGSCTNLSLVPVNGTSVRLVPQQNRWVSYTPSQNATVGPMSSQVITFIADANGQPAGTSITFNAAFNWSTGGSNTVSVSANITAPVPVYSAVSSLSFTGAAGQVTSVPFIISNTNGTGPLDFIISDSIAAAAGYITTNPPYSWIDTATNTVMLTDPDPSPYITAADEGTSGMIPLAFAFPFYGSICTQLSVSANGSAQMNTTNRVLSLGDLSTANNSTPDQMIAPYWGDLILDGNSTLKYDSATNRFVFTWENVRQYGLNGGSNQTFQAILTPDGTITFQYKKLEGQHWANTEIGLRDTSNRVVRAGIREPGDRIVTTNLYGTVATQYVGAVSNRAVQFLPAQILVIRYTPDRGTVPAGTNAVITIIGDASNQSVGTNNISAGATLTIRHNASGNPAALAVIFTATNSQETVFSRAAALANDSDGDGLTDDAERIAGSDPQDVTSVFTPKVENTSNGASLSWDAPLDGLPRTYQVYFTTNLMEAWTYMDSVTNGTIYLDTEHSAVQAIYYKITAQ